MSDLVARLKELAGPQYPDDICGKELMGKAAERIKHLEKALRHIASWDRYNEEGGDYRVGHWGDYARAALEEKKDV